MKLIFAIGQRDREILSLGVPILVNQKDISKITWDNETWVDSGGFQIIKGESFTLEEVTKKYEILDADEYFSLDIPPSPCETPIRENFSNFEYLYSRFNVFPVAHLYNLRALQEAVDFYKQYTNRIALGSVASWYSHGYQKLAIAIYHYLRRKFDYVHVLGIGTPSTLNVFYKADSVDSSSPIRFAIFGFVYLPNGIVKHVPEKKAKRKVQIITKEETEELLSFLDKTRFPYEVDLNDRRCRVLINVWVMLKTKPKIKNKYTEYSRKVSQMTTARIEEEIEELCREVVQRKSKSLNTGNTMLT